MTSGRMFLQGLAGLAAAAIAEMAGGRVRIMGTPAEEGGGGKILMAREGAARGLAGGRRGAAGFDAAGDGGEIIQRHRFWWMSPKSSEDQWDFGARNLRSTRWLPPEPGIWPMVISSSRMLLRFSPSIKRCPGSAGAAFVQPSAAGSMRTV